MPQETSLHAPRGGPRTGDKTLLCALHNSSPGPYLPKRKYAAITFARDHALLELVSALQDTLQSLFQNTNLPSDTVGVKTGEYVGTGEETRNGPAGVCVHAQGIVLFFGTTSCWSFAIHKEARSLGGCLDGGL